MYPDEEPELDEFSLDSILEDDDEFDECTDALRAKWCMDGATTLLECAEKLRAFADYVEGLHEAGAVLVGPVEDDYALYRSPESEED